MDDVPPPATDNDDNGGDGDDESGGGGCDGGGGGGAEGIEAVAEAEAAAAAAAVEEEEKKWAKKKRRDEARERALFYLTTFFILLGVVSLFVFLFLVPFLIEPAVSTILMEFDERPATCVTARSAFRESASNCSQPTGWASCREGCTREIYVCAQIFVNYTVSTPQPAANGVAAATVAAAAAEPEQYRQQYRPQRQQYRWKRRSRKRRRRRRRRRRSPAYVDGAYRDGRAVETVVVAAGRQTTTYSYARVFPNVKGCGYPPRLNCTAFHDRYFAVGSTYPCYYSRAEPWTVITELDLAKSTRQLVYSVVFPVPCFVVSVVYVTLAYFCIYAGRHRAPRTVKRRVVRRTAGTAAASATAAGVSRAKTGSETTPLTGGNNSCLTAAAADSTTADAAAAAAAAAEEDCGSSGAGTSAGSEFPYRDGGDGDDDEDNDGGGSGTTCYGQRLRSTLAVDDSLSADREPVNALRLSEHTLGQSDPSNAPSATDLWSADDFEDDEPDVVAATPFSAADSAGNLTKTMTTCISTPPGPTAEV